VPPGEEWDTRKRVPPGEEWDTRKRVPPGEEWDTRKRVPPGEEWDTRKRVPPNEMTIYLVAGEASGDQHGAALMRALRELSPDIDFRGRGGPKMQAVAGDVFVNWSDSAAVVGLWEVVKRYGYFREQFQRALREIGDIDPGAVIL